VLFFHYGIDNYELYGWLDMCIGPIRIINNPLGCLHLDLILILSTLQNTILLGVLGLI